MKMIGIIGAMEAEIATLKNSLKNMQTKIVGKTEFFTGEIDGKGVVVVQSGIGKVNGGICATILKVCFNCSLIINTGIAGGTNLTSCEDVIIGEKCAYHDVDVRVFGYKLGQVPGDEAFYQASQPVVEQVKSLLNSLNVSYKSGVILSGDQFVTEKFVYEKMGINNVLACEMEGAAIAQTCVKLGVPFIVIRYISDVIGEKSQIENYKIFEEKMAIRSCKICLEIISKINL